MKLELGTILAAAIGYLLGSIPTAWLLVRWVTGKDLRCEGSTNIGARNAYDVTGHAGLAIAIAVLDAAKGAAAVLLARAISHEFLAVASAALSAVIGHNWSIFLRGRGGRGLATAAGIAAAVNWLPLVLWLLMYATGYFAIRRHVHVGNVAGTLGTAILLVNTPGALLRATAVAEPFHVVEFKIAFVAICIAILVRHLEPIRQLFREQSE
ncbi:MAG: glycerol-3-phosphate acyltransferase [Bacteroidota bacterium]|nr:glycerol-3-phosphate acyltransferase [Candidatus Kapabacteria bacterium]MDW8075144.1 glycerol-3-phosphate acyltransferase [Bacteroidota bacterium]